MDVDKVYVPVSEKVLRKLDQISIRTGLSEDQILSMALAKMLATLREVDNDNAPSAPAALV